MVAPRKQAASATTFNFGDSASYSKGGGIPEGDYIWADLTVQMYQATKQDGTTSGPPRLGVMITLKPLGEEGEERTQFYSFGTNAHQSWAPNPETGKGVVAIPGGSGAGLHEGTNWDVLRKSLMNSGLPEGILTDDMSVLEGMHVHMANVPEPEERKGFKSKTGEAAVEDRPRTIAVVTEIKDDGKPWEGTGGIPAAAPKVNGKPGVARPAATQKATTHAPVATQAAAASPSDGDDVYTAAVNAVTDALAATPNAAGCKKLQLRTSTFKEVNGKVGAAMAKKVLDTYFGSDASINELVSPLGYVVKGLDVVPA